MKHVSTTPCVVADIDRFVFAACQCYGHTNQCEYDADIDAKGLSIDIHGNYDGGGVCKNCRHHTTGVNCDKCMPGYYRPNGVPLDAVNVCRRKWSFQLLEQMHLN